MPDQNAPDQFDDERITKGLVTEAEISGLEKTLIEMYLEKAKTEGKTLVVLTDKAHYEGLKSSGEAFNGPNLYLLMDPQRSRVMDMSVVAFHLLDTKEGLFYAKLMQPR